MLGERERKRLEQEEDGEPDRERSGTTLLYARRKDEGGAAAAAAAMHFAFARSISLYRTQRKCEPSQRMNAHNHHHHSE